MGTTVILAIMGGILATPLGIRFFSSKGQISTRVQDKLSSFLPYFFCAFLVVVLDKIEIKYGESLASHFGWEYTSLIHSIEGDIVVEIQNWGNNVHLTYFLAFMYFITFTFMLYFSLTFYFFCGEETHARKIALAYLLNYLFVLPFYLFFPVTETWRAYEFLDAPQKMQALLFNFNRDILQCVTTFSALNNCFPSMHTSLSATIALISLHSKYKRYTLFCWISALLIILSTIYLGIHWVSDVAAGVILAVFVYLLCNKIDYEISFPFRIEYVKIGSRIFLSNHETEPVSG
jgi:membrane-associated phospholipid phosphatase